MTKTRAAVLREHLIRERGVSPQAYRCTFRTAHGSSLERALKARLRTRRPA
ncbi:MAG: hypothetical protein ACRDST_03360 [Pseudonocardiaceae bacterium]